MGQPQVGFGRPSGSTQTGVTGGGGWTAEDARQLARELQQRLADAEAIRRDLQRQGVDVAPLDRAIEALRGSVVTSLEDKRAEAALRQQVIEGLKAYEFALRRKYGDDQDARVLLERSGDVPPAFRAMVEEYYRALSKAPKRP
jgi:hypothetical protein